MRLHDALYSHINAGDRIVYLGNYIGYGLGAADVIDELLMFRRIILAKRGMIPSDLVYLRGAQEEMWQKILQLQFAPDPGNVLVWMLGNGLANTLYAYGISPHDGIEACRQGMKSIAEWTGDIRSAIRKKAGHEIFSTHLHRAAFTDIKYANPMLFVNSGIKANKPITEQGDSFWWAHRDFETIQKPYKPFCKIVRGYDPDHKGIYMSPATATIDGGCGFGGSLVCAAFDNSANMLDAVEF